MKNKRTFNRLHTFFNSKIGELYESEDGKKIITKYIKLIKENAVLKKQYDLYVQLEEGVSPYIKKNAKDTYVDEILNSFSDITKKELKESSHKHFWFLMDNNIITETENPFGKIKDDVLLYEGRTNQKEDWNYTIQSPLLKHMDYLLYEGKEENLSQFMECKKVVAENLNVKKNIINEQKNTEERIADFNQKYQGKLTNEEMNLVRELVKTTKSTGVLVEYQKSISNSINELIKITEDIELKDKYLQLKEQVLFEDFSNLDSIMKLFDIKQLVNEIKNNN